MKPKTIVFDVDGVLGDFVGAYTALARRLYPESSIPITHTHEHHVWDEFPGMGPAQISACWNYIANHPKEFWPTVVGIATFDEWARIRQLSDDGHRVYFASARSLPRTLLYTQQWIDDHLNAGVIAPGDRAHSSVVLTKRKGEFCRVVNADAMIDDKAENTDCAVWLTDGKTAAFIMDRPYNQGQYAPHSHRVKRVHSITDFLNHVEGIK